jgi:hypothetical protein
MGTEYYITCKDCKVSRGLDKYYSANIYPVTTRQEALDYREKIKDDSFRAALLVSFMGEHMNHNCVFHDEHNDEYETYCYDADESPEYKEDTDFWSEKDNE